MHIDRLALAGLLALLTISGCAGRRQRTVHANPACPIRGIIYVADGAGDYEAASKALREAIAEEGLPFRVETFEWSHGFRRVFADHLDQRHARNVSQWLAGEILAQIRCSPHPEIYLVGHSAGTNVILMAAEYLPPDSIERIVLLAPSVANDYDLRPALRCARGGVDVYYSERDRMFLGLATTVLGTSDGEWGSAAAGRTGFLPLIACPDDTALYTRLHQHRWDPNMRWTGNRGGHWGSYEPGFLHAYVLPAMLSR